MSTTVSGIGYAGLSLAVLLAQHNEVIASNIITDKIEKTNNKISPIQDDCIETYLSEKDQHLTKTFDAEPSCTAADFVIIVAPTNCDSQKDFLIPRQ